MNLIQSREGRTFMLHDADTPHAAAFLAAFGPRAFDPAFWRREGQVTGEAPGRGATQFLDTGARFDHQAWVLRPYRRGGLVGRLVESRYVWTGLARTRSFRELRLTAALRARGLPVPRAVAAAATRIGPVYEAALITVRLPDTRALAELLRDGEADAALLREVGTIIHRFHAAGLDHVDLNARNLLVDGRERIWLIDLDRCRIRGDGRWREANLARLARSLEKFGADADAMEQIRRGYASASG